jgi:hypothetical protein
LFADKDSPSANLGIPAEFRDDAVTFIGRLKTNLEQCDQGLIPETNWYLKLEFNKENFYMWKPSTGELKNYMLKIESCHIYVPMAQLNIKILNVLNAALKKEPAQYNYRELRCTTYPITAKRNTWESPDLRSTSQVVLKIYVAFVTSKAFNGDQVTEAA